MPLATGSEALLQLGIPAGILQLLSFGPMFISDVPDWVPRWVGSVIVIGLGCLWALWFFAVAFGTVEACRRRASDAELSPAALRIAGGPASGRSFAWARLNRNACRVAADERRSVLDPEGPPPRALVLEGLTVASSSQPEEIASFEALAATVSALGGPPGTCAGDKLPPTTLRCANCGAVLVPTREASTKCGFCGVASAVPDELRARFRAVDGLAEAKDRIERMVKRLLRQPGARFTNAAFVLATPPFILGFPLTAILFNEFRVERHILRGAHALWLIPFALGLSYGVALWLKGQVVGRHAIRLVTLSFGAKPPEREGEPWTCRACGAPLPDTESRLVLLCLYCHAANVTGLDLRTEAGAAEGEAGDLAAVLEASLAMRRRWRWLSLVAVSMLLGSVLALARAFPRTCRDGVRNGEETDVDCGGPCTRCASEKACRETEDCISARCVEGTCAAPTCADGVKNGGESDVDCGGPCAPCASGMFCNGLSKNCASGPCSLGGQCE
jgi:hypothetical protein